MYRVADDSGFIGIFDPHAYVSFVAEDWVDELESHFTAQMYHYRLLLWATGCEAIWRVEVRQEASSISGFRELTGPIVATGSQLCLTSYDSLTMGAQFEHISLPQEHNWDLYITVESGAYNCRIIQLQDPDDCSDNADTDAAEFVIELVKTDQPAVPWEVIPGNHDLI
jgi:hypothetical protein